MLGWTQRGVTGTGSGTITLSMTTQVTSPFILPFLTEACTRALEPCWGFIQLLAHCRHHWVMQCARSLTNPQQGSSFLMQALVMCLTKGHVSNGRAKFQHW